MQQVSSGYSLTYLTFTHTHTHDRLVESRGLPGARTQVPGFQGPGNAEHGYELVAGEFAGYAAEREDPGLEDPGREDPGLAGCHARRLQTTMRINVCVCVYIIHTYIHIVRVVCSYVCTCVCMYVYTYIHTYTRAYIYIYIYKL
jgi:hypothetical protein